MAQSDFVRFNSNKRKKHLKRCYLKNGASSGNRTRILSLGSSRSTIELYSQLPLKVNKTKNLINQALFRMRLLKSLPTQSTQNKVLFFLLLREPFLRANTRQNTCKPQNSLPKQTSALLHLWQ